MQRCFIQLQSYQGTESSVVNQIVGLQADIQNKTVVVLEDIVDTGTTSKKFIALEKENPAKIYIASLLLGFQHLSTKITPSLRR